MTFDEDKLNRIIKRSFRFLTRGRTSKLVFAATLLAAFICLIGIIGADINSIMPNAGWITMSLAFALVTLGTLLGANALILIVRKLGPAYNRPNRICIDIFLPEEEAEHRVYALKEAFEKWRELHGYRAARQMYVVHCAGTIFSFWLNWILQKTGLIKLIDAIVGRIK